MPKNYYVILGVSADATLDQIKVAFRRRAMELHPDRSGVSSGPFLEPREAYAILTDARRRRQYDREIIELERSRFDSRQDTQPPRPESPEAFPDFAVSSVFRMRPWADWLADETSVLVQSREQPWRVHRQPRPHRRS